MSDSGKFFLHSIQLKTSKFKSFTMAKRTVIQTLKDKDGDIKALLNPEEDWSPRTLDEVIFDIESEAHSYVIVAINQPETAIHVVNGPLRKYLRSDHDDSGGNNLDNLDTLNIEPPTFIGDYPDNKRSNWSDALQGVTHSADHWFFTQKTKIIKIHVSQDVDTDSNNATIVVRMPDELGDLGCDHFGDPDYFVFEDVGYLFIPVEADGEAENDCGHEPRIAVFRDDAQLTYLGASVLSKQNSGLGTRRAGWCAISPIDNLLYTSHNMISAENPVFRYRVNFEQLALDGTVTPLLAQEDLILTHGGDTVSIPKFIQGGCFAPSGFLFICAGRRKDHDEHKGGIRAFDHEGELLYRSSINHRPFKYEYKPGGLTLQEPEGITYWNLDAANGGLSAPHIGGQQHCVLLTWKAGRDDKYGLKHYRLNDLI
jgi:hypothetical protein